MRHAGIGSPIEGRRVRCCCCHPRTTATFRPGCEMTNQDLKPKPNSAEGEENLPAEEKRGGGGFVFHCTLAGHMEAISGISLPLGSDKLYSGSTDGSVRVWDCDSGKGLRTLFDMHRVGKTPVLFCALWNSNCIRLFNLVSFNQTGTFCKEEVRTIEPLDAGAALHRRLRLRAEGMEVGAPGAGGNVSGVSRISNNAASLKNRCSCLELNHCNHVNDGSAESKALM